MRLSGSVLNASCPSMTLPAVLFPDPDRPSSTSRSSEVDTVDEAAEEQKEEEQIEAEVAKVGEQGEEEKTGEWEDEAKDACEDPSSVSLN